MPNQLERSITREQAELLFDMDDSVPVCSRYRLVLVPTSDEAVPFESKEEVTEFVMWANRMWLENESW